MDENFEFTSEVLERIHFLYGIFKRVDHIGYTHFNKYKDAIEYECNSILEIFNEFKRNAGDENA